jgi:uncharacterized DUF497 family protein
VADLEGLLAQIAGFEWDEHNTTKNVPGHNVSQAEAEEILTAAFTIRSDRIRIISVRDMSRKERQVYEKAR